MSAPSYAAADCERNREEIARQANRAKHRGTVELHIGVKLATWLSLFQLLQRLFFGQSAELEELRRAGLLRHTAQHLCARILRLVHAVTKAHQAFTAIQGVVQPRLHVLGCANLVEHVHHLGRGSTVGGALQRADGANEAAGDIRIGAGDNAGGEGAGVQAMIGQQHEIAIEALPLAFGRFLPCEHVKEVLGGVKIGSALNRFLPFAQAIKRCRDCRESGSEFNCFFECWGAFKLLATLGTKKRYAGTKRIHRVGFLANLTQTFDHRLRKLSICTHEGVHFIEFLLIRQVTFPQQVSHFLERSLTSQFMDIVAAVHQLAIGTKNVAQRGVGGNDSIQTVYHNASRRIIGHTRSSFGSRDSVNVLTRRSRPRVHPHTLTDVASVHAITISAYGQGNRGANYLFGLQQLRQFSDTKYCTQFVTSVSNSSRAAN